MQPLQITRMELVGFGQFRGRTIRFGEGLNLVEGENEAGKSTLQAFLTGMFYGFFQPAARRRSYTSHQERYKPWDGGSYRGVLVCRCGERVFRIERSFDRENESVRVFDEQTGEDCTQEFPYHPVTRQAQVGETLLGMSKTAFTNTASIAQLGCGSIAQEAGFAAELGDRLVSMAKTADANLSLRSVLARLEQQMDAIGTPKKSKTPYGQACQRRKELESEWELACRSEEEQLQLRRRKKELEKQIAQLQGEKELLEAAVRQGCARQLEERFLKAQNIKQRIERLEREQEQYRPYNGVDLAAVDLAQKKLGARMQIVRTAEKYRRTCEQLHRRRQELEQLYATLRVHGTGDELSRFELMCDRSRQIEQLEEELQQLSRSQATLLQGGQTPSDSLRKLEADVQTLRSLGRSRQEKARASAAGWTALGAGLVLLIAAAVTAVALPQQRAAGVAAAIVGMAVLLAGLLWLLRPGRSPSRQTRQLQENILRDYPALRTLDRPLAAMEKQLDAQRSMFEQEIAARRRQAEQLRQQLEQYLLALTGDAHADIRSQALREAVAQARRIRAELDQIRQQEGQMQQEEHSCARQIEQIDASIAEVLEGFCSAPGASVPDELERCRIAKRRCDELAIELSLQRQLLEETLDGYDYAQLEREAAASSLAAKTEPAKAAPDPGQLEALAGQLEALSRQEANLDGLLRGSEQARRPSGQVQAELEAVREQCEEYRFTLEALSLAKEKLLGLSDRLQRDFAPQLGRRVSAAVERITDGRYTRVVIDQGLGVRLEDRTSGQLVELARLSSGTVDLVYLLMRIELLHLLCGGKVQVPLILDDSFTQMDDRRAAALLRYLLERGGQILLFSCHGRERRMLQQAGLPFASIVL